MPSFLPVFFGAGASTGAATTASGAGPPAASTAAAGALPATRLRNVCPDRNRGTCPAGTSTGRPVRGLRALRAGRARLSNVPNPVTVTRSPADTRSITVSNTASTCRRATDSSLPARSATILTSSLRFMRHALHCGDLWRSA